MLYNNVHTGSNQSPVSMLNPAAAKGPPVDDSMFFLVKRDNKRHLPGIRSVSGGLSLRKVSIQSGSLRVTGET
jgi:hypothetical protein